jgi:ABC-type Fe3+ transport system permease subunit
MILALTLLVVLALALWWARAAIRHAPVRHATSPQAQPDDSMGGRPAGVNLRLFGTIVLLAAATVLAFGVWLWSTGSPDDGQYHVQASNVFELTEKNQAAVARRQSARLPLIIGGIGIVLGGGLMVSARR